MTTLLLILKYRPHLELEWLCTTLIMLGAAGITLDFTVIITALVGAVVSITGIYYTFQAVKLNQAIKTTNEKVVDLKDHINSRMDKMIAALEAAAVARGHLAGVESEKARQAIHDSEKKKK